MEAAFLRVLSFILSVLMFFFNGLSAAFPGIFPQEPVENYVTVTVAGEYELDEPVVVSDYVSWLEVGIYSGMHDWKYFFIRNTALIPVELSTPGKTIEVKSAEENGDILELEYEVVSIDAEFPDVECTRIIIVETSKNISQINAKETEYCHGDPVTPEIPEIPEEPEVPQNPVREDINYGIYSSENFSDDFIFNGADEMFEDYESWSEYYVGSDEELGKYDEKYFEEKNLAVIYIEVPDDGKTIEILGFERYANAKNIVLKFRVKNGESDYTKGFWAVVAEVEKDVSFVSYHEIGIKGESVLIESEMFISYYMPIKEDGRYTIVSNNSEFKALQNDAFMTEYSFTDEFFEESSLALIYVMLPNCNYYVEVESQTENGDTLEIEYSTTLGERVLERYKAVKYMVLAAEISKDITEVNAVEKSFKNIYRSFYTQNFTGITDEVQVVSDYETWTGVYTSDSAYLNKYDEEYFENNSVVLLSETMPDTSAYFDVVKLKENGNTLELVYGIEGSGGFSVIENKTLVVEVSKAVKTVSAERKDLSNYCRVYDGAILDRNETASPKIVIISDYAVWKMYVPEATGNPAKYDAEYFKNKSVVLVGVSLSDSACTAIVRYAYEEDGALNIGIDKHRYDTVGLDVICYETVVVEVSKDVTQINAEVFE